MEIDADEINEFLAHFGVKGMRWGVRRERPGGASRKVDREARKDAEESARAKMYYGKGAGNRRKLINKSVEAKRAKDPIYAKAFETHLARQDLSEHASGARTERKRTDRKEKSKQRAGYLARRFTGEMGTQAAVTATILAGAAFAASPRGRSIGRKLVTDAKIYVNSGKGKQTQKFVSDYFARNS